MIALELAPVTPVIAHDRCSSTAALYLAEICTFRALYCSRKKPGKMQIKPVILRKIPFSLQQLRWGTQPFEHPKGTKHCLCLSACSQTSDRLIHEQNYNKLVTSSLLPGPPEGAAQVMAVRWETVRLTMHTSLRGTAHRLQSWGGTAHRLQSRPDPP